MFNIGRLTASRKAPVTPVSLTTASGKTKKKEENLKNINLRKENLLVKNRFNLLFLLIYLLHMFHYIFFSLSYHLFHLSAFLILTSLLHKTSVYHHLP